MRCIHCGYIIPEDSDFCQFCGARVHPTPDATPMPEPVPVENTVTPKPSAKEIADAQRYFDTDYGYSPDNPIVTSSVHMVGYCLYALRTEDGQSFTWERLPRCYGAMIDEYQLFIDGTPYKKIFFNPHGEDGDFVPRGLVKDPHAFAAAQKGVSLEEYKDALLAEERRKARRKTRWRWVVAILLLLIASVPLTVFLLIPGVKFLEAKNLLNDKDYDGAYSAFCELGSFASAADWAIETQYQKAMWLRLNKDFDVSNKIFESLGNYRDSAQQIHYHQFVIQGYIRQPTCEESGVNTLKCSCGELSVMSLRATGHDYETVSTTNATCTKEGQMVLRCVHCGKEMTKKLQPNSHSYKAKTTTAATCTSTGVKTYTCAECKDSYTETIEKTAHTYSAATCTSAKTCKTCGKASGSALGHTNTAVCTRCGTTLFKEQFYTGQGPGNIRGITLPEGTYDITFAHTAPGNFVVKFNSGNSTYDRLIVNEIGYISYNYQLKVSSSSPVNNGYFNITHAGGPWAVFINAV